MCRDMIPLCAVGRVGHYRPRRGRPEREEQEPGKALVSKRDPEGTG